MDRMVLEVQVVQVVAAVPVVDLAHHRIAHPAGTELQKDEEDVV
jgi:hypothetical protein